MESENMLCVVKALDIMPGWSVVGTPAQGLKWVKMKGGMG